MMPTASLRQVIICLMMAGWLSYGPLATAADGIQVLFQPLSSASTLDDVAVPNDGYTDRNAPQRVDYRDRNRTTADLGLLGASTGMCSYGGDCDFCAYRNANPCQVLDRYGANTTLCQLPGFLGGSISEDTLCAMGANADIVVSHNELGSTSSSSSASGSSVTAATLTAFRTRDGLMMITVTTRCGWLLVPSPVSAAAATASSSAWNSAGSNSSNSNTSQQQLILLEGNATYNGMAFQFVVPLQQQSATAVSAAAAEVTEERYSCFTAALPLQGLTSSCQALELGLNLRLALRHVALGVIEDTTTTTTTTTAAGSAEEGAYEYYDDADVVCETSGSVHEAQVQLTMKPPQVRQRLEAVVAAATEAVEDSLQWQVLEQQQEQEQELQQLFSYGVGAAATFAATLDPRTSESSGWLQSLSSQSPLVSTTTTRQSLSFLVGRVQQTTTSPSSSSSSGVVPLLPASLDLHNCGRQAVDAVAAAVVAALASQGVTDKHVADVVCLQSPYSTVPATELPPCASLTSLLFNVSLDMPLGLAISSTGSYSSTTTTPTSNPSTVSYGTTSSSTNSGNGTDPANLTVLADALVLASFAAPWTCVSTESQMQMELEVHISMQLPKAPGVEETDLLAAGNNLLPPPPLGTSVVLRPPPPVAAPTDKQGSITSQPPPPTPAAAVVAAPAASASSALPASLVIAVVLASVLAALVAVAAYYAVRSAVRAKAAEKLVSALMTGGALAGAGAAGHAAAATAAAGGVSARGKGMSAFGFGFGSVFSSPHSTVDGSPNEESNNNANDSQQQTKRADVQEGAQLWASTGAAGLSNDTAWSTATAGAATPLPAAGVAGATATVTVVPNSNRFANSNGSFLLRSHPAALDTPAQPEPNPQPQQPQVPGSTPRIDIVNRSNTAATNSTCSSEASSPICITPNSERRAHLAMTHMPPDVPAASSPILGSSPASTQPASSFISTDLHTADAAAGPTSCISSSLQPPPPSLSSSTTTRSEWPPSPSPICAMQLDDGTSEAGGTETTLGSLSATSQWSLRSSRRSSGSRAYAAGGMLARSFGLAGRNAAGSAGGGGGAAGAGPSAAATAVAPHEAATFWNNALFDAVLSGPRGKKQTGESSSVGGGISNSSGITSIAGDTVAGGRSRGSSTSGVQQVVEVGSSSSCNVEDAALGAAAGSSGAIAAAAAAAALPASGRVRSAGGGHERPVTMLRFPFKRRSPQQELQQPYAAPVMTHGSEVPVPPPPPMACADTTSTNSAAAAAAQLSATAAAEAAVIPTTLPTAAAAISTTAEGSLAWRSAVAVAPLAAHTAAFHSTTAVSTESSPASPRPLEPAVDSAPSSSSRSLLLHRTWSLREQHQQALARTSATSSRALSGRTLQQSQSMQQGRPSAPGSASASVMSCLAASSSSSTGGDSATVHAGPTDPWVVLQQQLPGVQPFRASSSSGFAETITRAWHAVQLDLEAAVGSESGGAEGVGLASVSPSGVSLGVALSGGSGGLQPAAFGGRCSSARPRVAPVAPLLGDGSEEEGEEGK
ncbi:hypothetical protein Agub_g10050 [Astrephomene gubernaculifera]|uniref:Uncharacterized protein n=1 Tax=Astrephomene gubernaculifera TaxID=47775 RepID=A0AAD3DUB4_9CHLO|nr:hypothetical protein Agub_g10050 [Astrephomene gubernaculifera]